ncbi:MAG: hypothetical protein DMF86_13650 [Acidobacteria bacterium]|nr:MAG: hypothetical protein DMF86_13650 [Acidobacteriota bacterium]
MTTGPTALHRGSSGARSRPCVIAATTSRPIAESPAVSSASTAIPYVVTTRKTRVASGSRIVA